MYAILLFLAIFVQSSFVGFPIGAATFVICEALRFNHATCIVVGIITWLVVSIIMTFSTLNSGFR